MNSDQSQQPDSLSPVKLEQDIRGQRSLSRSL